MDYRIIPPEGWLEATVELPLSKSVAARRLVISFLTGAIPAVAGDAALPDDTRVLLDALTRLRDARGPMKIYIDGAGTVMRFLTAAVAVTPGLDVEITGNDRMLHRPIMELAEALVELGADINYTGADGYPPLHIRGKRLSGGEIEIDGGVSSQFVSALMMIAPLMEAGLKISLRGEVVSLPYVRLTAAIMESAGAEVDIYGGDTIEIKPGGYSNISAMADETDWSAAAPWYSITALSGGEVTARGLNGNSRQPDRQLADIFHKLGVDTGFSDGAAVLTAHPDAHARLDLDMTGTPDAVPAVVVTCAMLGIPFVISGLSTLRIKECDRVEALVTELAKVGVQINLPAEGVMAWDGRRLPILEVPRFATYGDHRMVMAFVPVALYIPGIIVENADVVSKSYPGFLNDLSEAGFILEPEFTVSDIDAEEATEK